MKKGQEPRVAARGWARCVAVMLVIAALGLLAPGQSALADRGGDEQSRSRVQATVGAEFADDGLYVVEGRDVDYPEPEPEPPAGALIAGFALGYLGYPYVAAGSGPYGFDCSGFTRWVVLNVVGVEIGTGLDGQPGAGAWVDYGAWLPGDLVFFQNTYRAGLSHAGIYLRDGLFIHAENAGTGVVISSMYSAYYGPRYWGAVRVA